MCGICQVPVEVVEASAIQNRLVEIGHRIAPRRFILRRAEVTVPLPRGLSGTLCMATCKTHVPQAVSQYWMLHQWYLVAPGSHWSRLPLVKNASENTQAVRTPTEHSDTLLCGESSD